MDDQRRDPKDGSSPNSARVEDDIVRTLRPRKNASRLRLPAALPFAIAGILVVSSIAFGANVMSSIVTPDPGATAVVVGDDDPTDAPTLVPTEAPTTVVTEAPIAVITEAPTEVPTAVPTKAPTAVPTKAPTKAPTKTNPPATTRTAPPIASMTLTAVPNGKIVNLSWSKYTGDFFKYYGIVRSESVPEPTLQLGTVPYLYFDNINTLTATDTTKAGHTYHYRAYAFTDETFATGNVIPNCQANTILAVSNIVDVVIPAASPTPAPTAIPSMGDLAVNDTLAGVTFSWTAYTGGGAFTAYRIAYETVDSGKDPSAANGSKPWTYPGVTATTAGPITIAPGDYNARLEAIGTVNGSLYIFAKTTVAHVHVAAAP